MKKLFVAFFLFTYSLSFSQGEANIWYFGENAGLDFNSGSPVAINNGKLSTREGCSSFSDANGNLLFYSDGTTVWNANHVPMPNGNFLKGDSSSSQSAMIIPKPNSENEYYIFTVGANSSDNAGFHYYTVDMTKNSGLGDIVAGPIDLNEGVANLWSEKVAAINGAECETFWVISYVLDTFKAYKITQNGVVPNPVSTKTNYAALDRRGYLKISPDGKKIAIAHMQDGRVFLYDFNNLTGAITNQQEINFTGIANSPYGIEFSGNGQKLYVHASNDYFNEDVNEWNKPSNHFSALSQFDLTKPTIQEIINSKVILDEQNLYRGALQLGPDQKIYRSLSSSYYNGLPNLGVIENPEADGLNCNYIHNAINLGSSKSSQGLPPFIASIFYQIEIINEDTNEKITNQSLKLCVGKDYTFNTEPLNGVPKYIWKHKDSIVSTSPSLIFSNIQEENAGLYQIQVDLVDDCGKSIVYKGEFEVEVYNPPVVLNSIIYDQCDIDSNSIDGVTLFNLNSKIEEITDGDPDLEVNFYRTEQDLENRKPIVNPTEFISTSQPQLIFNVTNIKTTCSTFGYIELNVFPTSLETYKDEFICEKDLGLNEQNTSISSAIGTFDFENKRSEIFSIFSNEEVVVEFYENSKTAQQQVNPLNGSLEIETSQIYVRISNKENNNCISAGTFNLIINEIPLPNNVDETIILCVGNSENDTTIYSIALDGNTNVSKDRYQWFLNEQPIANATNSIYFATKEGNYKVEVYRDYENNINDGNYCTGFSKFKVVESNIPSISIEHIEIKDDSNSNSISINPNLLGIGDYEFALDDFFGEYQDEPYFENISADIHTIYIFDKNGCGFDQLEVSVLGFPRFFTPNNDGFNDTWKILGANNDFYPNSNIHIYDRFGKLITTINPNHIGWDGTYNGKLLPSTDYWFSAELYDKQGKLRIRKGHFSLIRR